MDALDRLIINQLQDGIPLEPRPFTGIAAQANTTEQAIVDRIQSLLNAGVLTRFGPMYDAERLGGKFSLAAMTVPDQAINRVAEQLRLMPEIAHNYERDHPLNIWFVIATETPEQVGAVIQTIEAKTGCKVYNFPKTKEHFVGLKLEV